jgi:hypothetical protein
MDEETQIMLVNTAQERMTRHTQALLDEITAEGRKIVSQMVAKFKDAGLNLDDTDGLS